MPRKSRTPPPPRRVQAPKTRSTPRAPDERGSRRNLLIGSALVLLVAIAAVAGFLLIGGGESAAATLRNAGCTFDTFPVQEGRHVEELPEGYEYNSDPPTSGVHNPIPAPLDVYAEPVEPLRYVHNLEHGGIVILYGGEVPQQTVERMVDWYRASPNGILISPAPDLGGQISLAAWNADVDAFGQATDARGVLAKCPTFDEQAFDAFVGEYRFKGPERFAPEDLEPGE